MTRGRVLFVVHGTPVPQGSKRVFGGRAVDANAKRLRPWRSAVSSAAAQALADLGQTGWMVEPLFVGATFLLPRPKVHYAKDGSVKISAPRWAPRNPDIDKLLRALLDGMTDAGVWRDDAQVVGVLAKKRYADQSGPGAYVVVVPADDARAALEVKEDPA